MKLGLLGLGEGRSLMSAALASDAVELRTICDLNEELCRERCHEFSFDRYTLKYEDMLRDDEIDVIGIYTPDRFHADHILQAIEHGKHVICTKPLMESLKPGPALLAATKKNGRWLFVGQSTRFFEPFIKQREDFDAGRLGPLYTVEAHYNYDHRWFIRKPWTKPETFKWLYGCICHPADLVRWYLPNIEEVMGYGMLTDNGRAEGLRFPDAMHFVMKTFDGRIARVTGCYSGPIQPVERESGLSCVLRCSVGASQADYHELRYSVKVEGQPGIIQRFEGREDYYFRFEGQSHHAGEYQNYLEYVAGCMAHGESPKPDLEEGLVTMALLEAMEVSMDEGRPVKVKEILAKYELEQLSR